MSAVAEPAGFRNYGEGTRSTVHELYRQNHGQQTLDFVRAKKREYLGLERLTLNNANQDPSHIRTCLAYQMFTAAGRGTGNRSGDPKVAEALALFGKGFREAKAQDSVD